MLKNIINNKKLQRLKTKITDKLNTLKKNKYINIYLIIIFIFSIYMISPIFFNYFMGDDTTFHASNIAIRGTTFFNLFSKVIPGIGNNLGYGVGLFYPQLPHFLGGLILNIISFLGFKEYASLKLIKLLTIFGAGISMYALGFKIFKKQTHGLIASLFYISSSYFFVDLFSRDALNESFVFVFVPIIFLGIYYLFEEKNQFLFYLYFVLGYVGMMYSHLVMSVWFTIILIIFLLLFIKDIFKKQNLISLINAAVLILIFTSPFTVPLIEHMINGKYVIFNAKLSTLTSTFDYKQFLVQIVDITGNHNYLYTNFNIVVIMLSIVSLFKLFTNRIPLYRKKFIIGFLIIGIINIFLACNNTIWYFVPKFLNNLQFPWRLCTFASFGICIFAVEGLDEFYELFKKKFIPIASLLIIIILAANVYYNMQNIRTIKYHTYNINEGMGWGTEYLPIETLKNIEYFNKRKDNKIKIEKGTAKVKIINNEVPNMEFKVSNIKEKVTLELPRLYYLGYKIEDENGHEIKYSKNKNGFISIVVNKEGSYYVTYPGTLGYQISKTIVIITSIVCITIIVLKKRKQNNN